jgi:uncharacterized damage-inducible protein DinB
MDCLRQALVLMELLTEKDLQAPAKGVFSSTIGGHLRHVTDHYRSFLSGLAEGMVDYDARERSVAMERDPKAATDVLNDCLEGLAQLADLPTDVELKVKMDCGAATEWSRSGILRELQFLLSHTVHHFALIVAVGSEVGIRKYPEGFGVAPSTLRYEKEHSAQA